MTLPKVGTRELIEIIRKMANQERIDPDLAVAIAGVETNYHQYRTRFEPVWSYFCNPQKYATDLGVSLETEKTLQAISWGAMQVMGAVCRELGYSSHLVCLVDPEVSIHYACKKLKILSKRYPEETDLISSYNAGSPRKDKQGIYINKKYVDHVTERLKKLRSI